MVNIDTSSNEVNDKNQNNLDVQKLLSQPYKYGFKTNVEVEDFPKGINSNVIKLISLKKKEPSFMLDFRLRAYEYWKKIRSNKCPAFACKEAWRHVASHPDGRHRKFTLGQMVFDSNSDDCVQAAWQVPFLSNIVCPWNFGGLFC